MAEVNLPRRRRGDTEYDPGGSLPGFDDVIAPPTGPPPSGPIHPGPLDFGPAPPPPPQFPVDRGGGPITPSSPFPPNVPIGNTGQSTPAPQTSADEIRRRLEAVSRGLQVTDQDIADAQRVNQGESIESRLQEFANQYARRAAPTSGRMRDSQSGFYDNTPADSSWLARMGVPGSGDLPAGLWNGDFASLFDDPATSQLEQLIRSQLGFLNNPTSGERVASNRVNQLGGTTPAMDNLLGFINQRFGELAGSNGYSPQELAILRTQALEPIEAYRHASKQRALERTGARGILPSSGLHEMDVRDIDMSADRSRVAADRDLAINSINERSRRLNEALGLGTQAYQIPEARSREQLDVAQLLDNLSRTRMQDQLSRSSLLYELPQRAQSQALSVLNGSPGPESLFGQFAQQAQLQQQQQQYNAQRNAQVWSAIGQMLASFGQ